MIEKNQRILHLTLVLLLMTPPPAESFIFTALITAVSFAYQAYNMINDAHDTYKKFAPQTTLDDVLDQAKRVEEKVDHIGAKLSNQISQAVDSIVTRVDEKANMRDGLKTLSQGIRRIDNLYRLFEMYTSKKISLNNHTLQDYIQQVTTVGALSPKDILNEIYDLIIPGTGFKESLIYYLKKNIPEDDTYTCGNGAPAQENFYQIFRLIMVNEIRAFTMLAFSYSLNQAFRCESYKGEIELAEYDLRSRAMDYYDVFLEVAEESANSVRSCDPPDGWWRDDNFYELERFKTEYLVNQRAFRQINECKGYCEDLMPPSTIQDCDSSFGCDPENICLGNLYNCGAMSYPPVTVCQLIQQGVAVTEGRIVPDTVKWKRLAPMNIDDVASELNKQLAYYWIDSEGIEHEMKESEDFLAFDWKSHRIYLDNLIIPSGYVITGARFNTPVKNPNEIRSLQLEIHASPYDYDSGKIVVTDDNPSIWLTPEDMVGVSPEYDREREEIHFSQLKNPEHEEGTFIPSSPSNSYLDVQKTSSASDAGQTVIPFLDAQEVAGRPAFAAGGIGMYLKTATPKGSGFLGFRVYELESMKNIPMHALDQMDKYSQSVTAFKGCNEDL